MCAQHNVRASVEDNAGQNTDKEDTPNPKTEIKIPVPAGNQTRKAGALPTTPRRRVFSFLVSYSCPPVTGLYI